MAHHTPPRSGIRVWMIRLQTIGHPKFPPARLHKAWSRAQPRPCRRSPAPVAAPASSGSRPKWPPPLESPLPLHHGAPPCHRPPRGALHRGRRRVRLFAVRGGPGRLRVLRLLRGRRPAARAVQRPAVLRLPADAYRDHVGGKPVIHQHDVVEPSPFSQPTYAPIAKQNPRVLDSVLRDVLASACGRAKYDDTVVGCGRKCRPGPRWQWCICGRHGVCDAQRDPAHSSWWQFRRPSLVWLWWLKCRWYWACRRRKFCRALCNPIEHVGFYRGCWRRRCIGRIIRRAGVRCCCRLFLRSIPSSGR